MCWPGFGRFLAHSTSRCGHGRPHLVSVVAGQNRIASRGPAQAVRGPGRSGTRRGRRASGLRPRRDRRGRHGLAPGPPVRVRRDAQRAAQHPAVQVAACHAQRRQVALVYKTIKSTVRGSGRRLRGKPLTWPNRRSGAFPPSTTPSSTKPSPQPSTSALILGDLLHRCPARRPRSPRQALTKAWAPHQRPGPRSRDRHRASEPHRPRPHQPRTARKRLTQHTR
jgi:hypothetical protein